MYVCAVGRGAMLLRSTSSRTQVSGLMIRFARKSCRLRGYGVKHIESGDGHHQPGRTELVPIPSPLFVTLSTSIRCLSMKYLRSSSSRLVSSPSVTMGFLVFLLPMQSRLGMLLVNCRSRSASVSDVLVQNSSCGPPCFSSFQIDDRSFTRPPPSPWFG